MDENARATLVLQLQDIDRFLSQRNQSDDVPYDTIFALQLEREELLRRLAINDELRRRRDIEIEEPTSSKGIDSFQNGSQMADHVARHVYDGQVESRQEIEAVDDLVDKLSSLKFFDDSSYGSLHYDDIDGAENGGEPSQSANAKRRAEESRDSECVSCGEGYPDNAVFLATCSHEYCKYCLNKLYDIALTQGPTFPPRCCRQPFELRAVERYLSSDVLARARSKTIEFNTKDRTYCSRPDCFAFILPNRILGTRATCPECYWNTCTRCKEKSHTGKCDSNRNAEILKLSEENGWQQCPECKTLVEITVGCRHIICRCQAEFCYNCGAVWKTCDCRLFNFEDDEDAEVPDRPRRPPPLVPVRRARRTTRNREARSRSASRVANAEYLHAGPLGIIDRNDHNQVAHVAYAASVQRLTQLPTEQRQCHHAGHWVLLYGVYECEICYRIQFRFINHCLSCGRSVCHDCRRRLM